jgi:hypothetical protein
VPDLPPQRKRQQKEGHMRDDSTNTITTSNSLADLAARIRAEHEASAVAMQRGLEHAVNAGRLLIEAKAQLEHGQWLPWLQQHCQMSERSAQVYMRLARRVAEIKANPQATADLSIEAALALIAKPSVAEAISEPEAGPAAQLERSPWLEMLWRFRLELVAIDPRIEITSTRLKLPDDLPYEKWKMVGALMMAFLGPLERAVREARS